MSARARRPARPKAPPAALPELGARILAGEWPLVGAAAMRALDTRTIGELGVPGELLMECAGHAVAEAALDLLREQGLAGVEVVAVCGAGNNGGDGLVAARHLWRAGVRVRAALLVEPRALRGDAAANLARARGAGVPMDGPRWRPPARGVVLDAIFGTGLTRKVEGVPAASIRRIAAARSAACSVLSVDLPSGLDADTGAVLGHAVHADVTLTVGLPKLGLALEPGRSLAGAVRVARIGIADESPGAGEETRAWLWSPRAAGAHLPARPRDGHKGSFGHVLVVAGSEGKTGAATLSALGAARAGAGLVSVACPAGLNDILEVKCTEAMTVPVPDTPRRGLAAGAADAVLALVASGVGTVVALGPGVGREAETGKCVREMAERLAVPLVLDADGLYAFGRSPGALRARRSATVITPHPGEASRLLGVPTAAINADRVAAARRLAAETGAVALLKGAATVVAEPEGRALVNPTGGPALASGGTGDVLTGVVAAFLAQGLPPFEAAGLAAWVHGRAGERAVAGAAGLLAGDLAGALPSTIAELAALADRAARGRAAETGGAGGSAGAGLALPFPGP